MRFNYRSAAVLVALIYNRPRGPGTKRGGKKHRSKAGVNAGPGKTLDPLSPSFVSVNYYFFFRAIVRTG